MEQEKTNSTQKSVPEKAKFVGEEGDESSVGKTSGKDFAAALFISGFAIAAMILASQLRSPGAFFTSPGLLPFLTGLTLLLMAIGLGVKAWREGGNRDLFKKANHAVFAYFENSENRRTLLLISIVVLYVVLLNFIYFDLRLPTSFFEFRFSSYELISIGILTLILRIFWKATLLRCVTVSTIWSVLLASVFRYGFQILLP